MWLIADYPVFTILNYAFVFHINLTDLFQCTKWLPYKFHSNAAVEKVLLIYICFKKCSNLFDMIFVFR